MSMLCLVARVFIHSISITS